MRAFVIVLSFCVILALDPFKPFRDRTLEQIGNPFPYRTKNSSAKNAYTNIRPVKGIEIVFGYYKLNMIT
jgi:hypothetical protein